MSSRVVPPLSPYLPTNPTHALTGIPNTKVVQSDERLLKLYESGLPGWAIYAPQYGVWYRPWMRRITYMLFVLVSAFSLVMGFYDLYKNVPYLDKVPSHLLPPSSVLNF